MSLLLTLASLTPVVGPTPESAPLEPTVPVAPVQDADDGWSGSVNVGGIYTDGNTRTSALSVTADATRTDGENRYTGDASYNYSRNRAIDDTSADNARLGLGYDRFLTEKAYVLGNASYFTDNVAALDARTIFGVGGGYQIEDTEEFKWSAEGGISFVDEDFAVDANDRDYEAGRIATALNWVINKNVSYTQGTELLVSLDDSDDQLVINDSRIDLSLSESMIASVQYRLNYDNTPALGNQRDDQSVILTVGWTF